MFLEDTKNWNLHWSREKSDPVYPLTLVDLVGILRILKVTNTLVLLQGLNFQKDISCFYTPVFEMNLLSSSFLRETSRRFLNA